MRRLRLLFVSVLALGLILAGVAATQATASVASHPVSHPRSDALTVPAIKLPRLSPAHTPGRTGPTANTTSQNWSGYVATNGIDDSVSSSWVEPTVSCTTRGIVAFWIGLDGWNSPTVEQDGTGVDCTSGSPQYFAWWETYPANSIQEYPVTVEPGDSISSTVSGNKSTYNLELTDNTRGWTENISVAGPAGAEDASAEVITEAVSSNGGITALPNFGDAHFSNSGINGASLQAQGAQAVDMINSGGALIDKTGLDDSFGDFTTYYGAKSNAEMAFQANTTSLWDAPSTGGGNAFGVDMASGTSPSIASVAGGGFVMAFEANTDVLWAASSAGGTFDLGQGMMAGTSPSIAGLITGGWEYAWQDPQGTLRVLGNAGNVATGLTVAAGTSPAIAASPDGGYTVAYQGSNGDLWTYSPSAGAHDLGLGMMAGTSPSITALSDGLYEMAVEANTGVLWTESSLGSGGQDTGQGMMTGTSPSIAGLGGGGWEVAWQDPQGTLLVLGDGGNINTGLGMAAGTSPAITALVSGGFLVAFQANTGALWTTTGSGGTNFSLGMASHTNPAIAD